MGDGNGHRHPHLKAQRALRVRLAKDPRIALDGLTLRRTDAGGMWRRDSSFVNVNLGGLPDHVMWTGNSKRYASSLPILCDVLEARIRHTNRMQPLLKRHVRMSPRPVGGFGAAITTLAGRGDSASCLSCIVPLTICVQI